MDQIFSEDVLIYKCAWNTINCNSRYWPL